jgi:hypothetical protein
MYLNAPTKKNLLLKKFITIILIIASITSFATLGDGGKRIINRSKNLLSNKYSYNFHTFSLKSGYNYRGNNVFNFNKAEKYIMLNTVITYQKGNSTYILPMKKKVLLDKITFRPSAPPKF